jgi:hypothetical protein
MKLVAGFYDLDPQEHTRAIMRLLVYVGRYGHQDWEKLERRTIRELNMFAEEIHSILEEENKANRVQTDGV